MIPRGLLLLAVVGTLSGAASAGERAARPIVVASVLPQKYLVERIADALVDVSVMIPPGASPETYEPTLSQMRQLSHAALYVKVGHPSFPFEAAWLDKLLASTPKLPVVDCSAHVERLEGDPHVWLAPRNVEQMAIQVEAALQKLLPQQRDELTANLAAFRREIDDLDRRIRGLLADRKGRAFLVFHPAWGYFAKAYGLRQIAIEHGYKEPDPHELALLIGRARKQHIRVVFVQPQFDAAPARTVAREIGARVEPLDPLAYDWPANLLHAARALAEATR